VEHPERVLASTNIAVVMVTAVLPPGIRKGDPIDIEVQCIDNDKTTSLRNGVLLPCDLYEYGDANRLTGKSDLGPKWMQGKKLAVAEGPIIVGVNTKNGPERQRYGRIWSGGHTTQPRDFGLILDKDYRDARLTKGMAQKINERFHSRDRGIMMGMAEAKTGTFITLRVPGEYSLNWPRYLRVVRQMSLRDSEGNRRQQHQRWAEELLDPSLTIVAALKLEAIGPDAIEELKRGLQSEHPLVRFSSAEALAYLGDPAAAEPLHRLIETDPKFRAYGITALASLKEPVAADHLRQLMRSTSAETRYGAFRALVTIHDRDEAVQGENYPGGFHLHRIAPESEPLVHLNTVNRAEVVIFGHEPTLLPPFNFSVGSKFVLTTTGEEGKCLLSCFTPGADPKRITCSLMLMDILRKMAGEGGGYGDAVELLQIADKQRLLSCPLAVDALPQAPTVYELALDGRRAGPGKPKGAKDGEDTSEQSKVDMGMTPNLFTKPKSAEPINVKPEE
jgi:hypothetical protein